MHKDDAERRQRHSQYAILVLIALSLAAGRIAVVRSAEGDTAFLSANDRSRWCTVAALVEDGTYEIDRLIEIRSTRNRRPWGTIDRVVHRGSDGEMHSYSSKPPLFSTAVAGVYAVFYAVSGLSLTEHPIYATRILLAMVNLPMLALFMCCTLSVMDSVGSGHWSRRFLAASICFGTVLLPFTITLNNHLPAAAATALVMWLYVSSAEALDDSITGLTTRISWWRWFVAGVAAAFVVANELPALAMFCVWWGLFALLHRPAMVSFTAGAGVVAIAFFATNWIAHESLRPPYAHRGVGSKVAEFPAATSAESLTESIRTQLVSEKVIDDSTQVWIEPSDDTSRLRVATEDNHWFALVPDRDSKATKSVDVAPVLSATSPVSWNLYRWDDWYEYPGSYWQDGRRVGVDRGEPSRLAYLFHATLGHHGLFSITPLWVLVPIGWVFGMRSGARDIRLLMAGIAITTLVCFTFYMLRPEIDRNYGGVSICFRWMVWFAPLWLLAMTPAVEYFSRFPSVRIMMMLALAVSVFSVAVSLENPWQSPWIYRYWSFLGWIGD